MTSPSPITPPPAALLSAPSALPAAPSPGDPAAALGGVPGPVPNSQELLRQPGRPWLSLCQPRGAHRAGRASCKGGPVGPVPICPPCTPCTPLCFQQVFLPLGPKNHLVPFQQGCLKLPGRLARSWLALVPSLSLHSSPCTNEATEGSPLWTLKSQFFYFSFSLGSVSILGVDCL